MMRAVYTVPKFEKNMTVARVEPAKHASTESPSRKRVCCGSLISFCRLIQPIRRDQHVGVFGHDEVLGAERNLVFAHRPKWSDVCRLLRALALLPRAPNER